MAPSHGVKREFRSFVPTPRRLVVSKRLVGNTCVCRRLPSFSFSMRGTDGLMTESMVPTWSKPSSEKPSSDMIPAIRREQSEVACSVCLEPYKEQVDTKCGHSFCKECIHAVLRTNPPENQGPCPFCRQPVFLGELTVHSTGRLLVPPPLVTADVVTLAAKVSGAWFGDDRYIPRVQGEGWSPRHTRDALTGDVWHVKSVCWFHCGAEVVAKTGGKHSVAFRVKRLPNLRFGSVILKLNGREVRRIRFADELSLGGDWELLHVGKLDVAAGSKIKAEMVGEDQGSWKRGLLIDCLAVTTTLSLSSGNWTVRWEDERWEHITLEHGRFTIFGETYELRHTSPPSFLWSDGTEQTMHAFDGNTITWTTDHPRYTTIYWDQVRSDSTSDQVLPQSLAGPARRSWDLSSANLSSLREQQGRRRASPPESSCVVS